MKAKDKAKELVEKHLKKIIELAYAETKTKELAKQCALICVDEMLKQPQASDKQLNFLIEVKQEIKKL